MLGLCYSKKILCNIVLLKKNLDQKCQHCERVRHYFGVKKSYLSCLITIPREFIDICIGFYCMC